MSIKTLLSDNEKPYQDLNVNSLNCNILTYNSRFSVNSSYIQQDYTINPIITTTTPLTVVDFLNIGVIAAGGFFDITLNYSPIIINRCGIFITLNNLGLANNVKCEGMINNIFNGSCRVRFRNFSSTANTAQHISFNILILTF